MATPTRKLHWGAIIAAITLVASLITIYQFAVPQFSNNNASDTISSTHLETGVVSSHVGFMLNWTSKDGQTSPSGGLVLCGSGLKVIVISVSPITNNPRPVTLSIQNPAAIPFYISYRPAFSPSVDTPPFKSKLSIVFQQENTSTRYSYNMTIVGDDGLIQTITIPIEWTPSC